MATSGQSLQHALLFDLGSVGYAECWDLQKRIQAHLIAAHRAPTPDMPPHVILAVQHPPVYTLGKSGDPANLLADSDTLERLDATFVKIDRGGDITFHGPGQLVLYPILDLNRLFTDIHRYLRYLEDAVIRTCADYGIEAGRVEGRTGVWVDPESGRERKICAMGIKCSRWVTMHGLALNVSTDLTFFDHIVPCGIADRAVTSLGLETSGDHRIDDVRRRLVDHLADRFGLSIASISASDSIDQLERYLEKAASL